MVELGVGEALEWGFRGDGHGVRKTVVQGERQVKGFLKEKESCLGLWQGSPAE